jgi:hypothetical protein
LARESKDGKDGEVTTLKHELEVKILSMNLNVEISVVSDDTFE